MIDPKWVKRCIDLVVSAAALLVLSPLLAALALAIRWELGSPVLFTQTRQGFGARPFTIYKFRTMTDARGPDGRLLPDAQRLTRFGRFLRASSLDELPELVNVLIGDMSLVGPRPLILAYVDRYTPEQARRMDVLPGLTGLAQISGRNALTWDERFRTGRRVRRRLEPGARPRGSWLAPWAPSAAAWHQRRGPRHHARVHGVAHPTTGKAPWNHVTVMSAANVAGRRGVHIRPLAVLPGGRDRGRRPRSCVRQGQLLDRGRGPRVRARVRRRRRPPHGVAVTNGTVALELALRALGVGPGDEVDHHRRTFIASASAAVMRGATPVFADVDRDSQNITAETIEPC